MPRPSLTRDDVVGEAAAVADEVGFDHLTATAVGVLASALGGCDLSGDDMIHAIRAFRIIMHGLVSLEAVGGFGLPQSLEDTFTRLVDGLHAALTSAGRNPAGETPAGGTRRADARPPRSDLD